MKLHFCKKQAMNRSASVIFRLVRLIILLIIINNQVLRKIKLRLNVTSKTGRI